MTTPNPEIRDEDPHAFCSAFHCCNDHPAGKPWHYPEEWDRHYAEAHGEANDTYARMWGTTDDGPTIHAFDLGFVGDCWAAEQEDYGYCSVTAEKDADHTIPVIAVVTYEEDRDEAGREAHAAVIGESMRRQAIVRSQEDW